jgi:hypothetical protein
VDNDDGQGLTAGGHYSYRICAEDEDGFVGTRIAAATMAQGIGAVYFMTSKTYDGNLLQSAVVGGETIGPFTSFRDGANARCAVHAEIAGFTGFTWQALLGSTIESGQSLLKNASGPLYRTDGSQLLADVSSLWTLASTPLAEIATRSEVGGNLTAISVWTGLATSGRGYFEKNCQNWSTSSNSSIARPGVPTVSNANFLSNSSDATCNLMKSLYCVGSPSNTAVTQFDGTFGPTSGTTSLTFLFGPSASDLTSVKIFRADGPEPPNSNVCNNPSSGTLVGTITAPFNNLNYTDSNLTPGAMYGYRVCLQMSFGLYSSMVARKVPARGAMAMIFRTSSASDGNLTQSYSYLGTSHGPFSTGVEGADNRCTVHASAAGLSAYEWRALISDTTESAAAKFSGLSGALYDSRGALQLENFSDIWQLSGAAELASPLEWTESEVSAGGMVYTGSLANGAISASHCLNWTTGTSANLGRNGVSATFTNQYAVSGSGSVLCNTLLGLYCVGRIPE